MPGSSSDLGEEGEAVEGDADEFRLEVEEIEAVVSIARES